MQHYSSSSVVNCAIKLEYMCLTAIQGKGGQYNTTMIPESSVCCPHPHTGYVVDHFTMKSQKYQTNYCILYVTCLSNEF